MANLKIWHDGFTLRSARRSVIGVEQKVGKGKPIVDVHVFFFFQAEDGIRDLTVTGVQTCALPIYRAEPVMRSESSISASASSLIGRRPSAAGGGPAMRF